MLVLKFESFLKTIRQEIWELNITKHNNIDNLIIANIDARIFNLIIQEFDKFNLRPNSTLKMKDNHF
jgi:hypothetical protein